ncbi:molybdopterin-dependent oxidoreductase [Youngiibacter fragilis]|uniref:Oxidoreductase molybdopterin-binding domain-containing protein n=1 Tax=Youngiibacter fragilis 232.1 TaxID=994573 RepID=V7I1Q3_9CLOT|nr:molybdopterin-dependent oxidoreductase [Youngiibacter fragilis]ETA79211.1 hypothetical protein T472_0218185 [Youngiibacter fragilis 232.1]
MKKIKVNIMAAAALAAVMIAVTGCGAKAPAPTTAPTAAPTAAPTSAQADGEWEIAIEGVEKSPAVFNEAEAAKVGLIKQKASVKDKDTSLPAQEWDGVSLEKVLEHYGVKTYTTVKVESSDGTFKEYTPDLISSSKALLGFKADGKELEEGIGPVQLVVDGKGPNWWIVNVTRITVIK